MKEITESINHITMDQIIKIKKNIDRVEYMIKERLPMQKKTLLTHICAYIWLGHVPHLKYKNAEQFIKTLKQFKLSVGSFQYTCAEQVEILTQELCNLDNIMCHGNQELRSQRKEEILRIQSLLIPADKLRVKYGDKLRTWGIQKIDQILEQFEKNIIDENIKKIETKKDLKDNEDKQEKIIENNEVIDHSEMKDENNSMIIDDDTHEQSHYSEAIDRLPRWNPPTRMIQDEDELVYKISLPNIPENQISIFHENGQIIITGYKFPSRKDLIIYRYRKKLGFGKFIFTIPVSKYNIDLDRVTYNMDANGLVVHLPRQISRFYPRYHPMISMPVYHPFGLAW